MVSNCPYCTHAKKKKKKERKRKNTKSIPDTK